jgi:2',3'-cyclic-nucleotide 2'-phosphodiesterase (5'-nucleotidase family)
VDIPLPRTSGETVLATVREIAVDTLKPLLPVDSIVTRAVARVGPKLNEVITTVPADLPREGPQYALGNIVADAFRFAGNADFAIENTAGVRAPLRAGPVTFAQLFEVQPFGNVLYKLRMTGAQFRQYVERIVGQPNPGVHVSGFSVSYNPQAPVGQRIVAIHLPEGRTLSDAAYYTLVINDFMLVTEPYKISDKSIVATPLPVSDFQSVTNYLRAQPQPLAIPRDPRLIQVIQ